METLNFIDIADWQAGIDLEAVFAQNDLSGVIVKATEGLKYVNPYCDKWVQWLIRNGKLWGFYHFLNSTDPVAEAKRFVKDTINYFGDGVPVADYEGNIVQSYGTYYLRRFLETVYAETGVKPLVYCNLSTIQSDTNGFRSIANDGYKLWLAQYATNAQQVGFLKNPWQQGSFAPFSEKTMHQYSGNGRLNGYGKALDLDIFYGNADDWNALAGNAPDPVDDLSEHIQTVIDHLEAQIAKNQEMIDLLKQIQRGL